MVKGGRKQEETPDFVWLKCESCCKPSKGVSAPNYYAIAIPERKAKRNPVCENCKGPLTEMYRIVPEA